ncbi:hypothetical protein SB861_09135 [Paraburkholderia sp. SIMBA_049]
MARRADAAKGVDAHRRLRLSTNVPVAMGESLYLPGQLGDYMKADA